MKKRREDFLNKISKNQISDELNNLRNVAVNETVYEDDGLN